MTKQQSQRGFKNDWIGKRSWGCSRRFHSLMSQEVHRCGPASAVQWWLLLPSGLARQPPHSLSGNAHLLQAPQSPCVPHAWCGSRRTLWPLLWTDGQSELPASLVSPGLGAGTRTSLDVREECAQPQAAAEPLTAGHQLFSSAVPRPSSYLTSGLQH